MTYTGQGRRRTQAEREAITVEIGYALFSAAFAAAVLFGAVAGPALLFMLPGTVERMLVLFGFALAGVLFAVRVVSVLIRFGRARRADPGRVPRGGGARPVRLRREPEAQPSHPGRTNPDS